MMALVGFRVIWGLVGTHYARFSSFWFGPRDAFAYLKKVLADNAERHVGHNPTGSVAIYLLLLLTLAVGITGFFTLGGEEQQGLLRRSISMVQSRTFKTLHQLSAWVMLLLLLGHLVGVVVESVLHHENLARSMLTGSKLANAQMPAARLRWRVAALLLVLMVGFGGWWFFYAMDARFDQLRGGTELSVESPHVKFVGTKLADNAQWREECGSCHIAFHPNLLPSRSWMRIMNEQARHFGSDLGLDRATATSVLTFLRANSADRHTTEAASKIDRSIKPADVPLRITETPYWAEKHGDIAAAQWQSAQVKSKTNCAACHLDAEVGTFQDAAMHNPKRSTRP